MPMRITKSYINALTYEIIGAAIEVHKELGPGLLESDYEAALLHELSLRGLKTTSQCEVEKNYKGISIKSLLRFDILVEGLIIIELKSVKDMNPIFDATIISYMKHMKKPKGILINFNVQHLFSQGQKTFVNEIFAELPDN
jgi:GxxExxY protein